MQFDPAARANWVRTFLASGQTQAAFCATHRHDGCPAERTLRGWLASGTVRLPDRQQVRAVLVQAIQKFTAMLQALDAEAAAGPAEPLLDVAALLQDVRAEAVNWPATRPTSVASEADDGLEHQSADADVVVPTPMPRAGTTCWW